MLCPVRICMADVLGNLLSGMSVHHMQTFGGHNIWVMSLQNAQHLVSGHPCGVRMCSADKIKMGNVKSAPHAHQHMHRVGNNAFNWNPVFFLHSHASSKNGQSRETLAIACIGPAHLFPGQLASSPEASRKPTRFRDVPDQSHRQRSKRESRHIS